MHNYLHLLFFVAGTLVSASCSLPDAPADNSQKTALAKFNIIVPEQFQTKSHYLSPEEEYGIYDYIICIWNTEHPYEYPALVITEDESTSVPLRCGPEYIVAAAINCSPYYNMNSLSLLDRNGNHPILDRYCTLNNLTQLGETFSKMGMMMVTSRLTRFTMEKETEIPLHFERLFARFEIALDRSELESESVHISSIQIKNSAEEVQPIFDDGENPHLPSLCVYSDGDYASDADLKKINEGKSIVLYAPENLQGTLLPGNTDPLSKNPDSIGASTARKCTFLEITGTHSRLGDVTYRCFLGGDNCTNFDIIRNTSYKVTITPSADGLGASCWKMSY